MPYHHKLPHTLHSLQPLFLTASCSALARRRASRCEHTLVHLKPQEQIVLESIAGQVLLGSCNTIDTQHVSLHQRCLLVTSFGNHPAPSRTHTVSTVCPSEAVRLQLAAFTAVVMRLQITVLAFRHGISRVHYDGLRLQFRTLLKSHMPTK